MHLNDKELLGHSNLLAQTFFEATGNLLIPPGVSSITEYLYEASFALVSHGVEDDPIFNYANLKAQELWEMGWLEFTHTPSRISAEPLLQAERAELLHKVQTHGYIFNYSGIRISKSGKRFMIQETTIWNMYYPQGNYAGQGAMFARWEFL